MAVVRDHAVKVLSPEILSLWECAEALFIAEGHTARRVRGECRVGARGRSPVRVFHHAMTATREIHGKRSSDGVAGVDGRRWRCGWAQAASEAGAGAAGVRAAAHSFGSSSPIRLFGCVGSRSRTSWRYAQGSTPTSLQL